MFKTTTGSQQFWLLLEPFSTSNPGGGAVWSEVASAWARIAIAIGMGSWPLKMLYLAIFHRRWVSQVATTKARWIRKTSFGRLPLIESYNKVKVNAFVNSHSFKKVTNGSWLLTNFQVTLSGDYLRWFAAIPAPPPIRSTPLRDQLNQCQYLGSFPHLRALKHLKIRW